MTIPRCLAAAAVVLGWMCWPIDVPAQTMVYGGDGSAPAVQIDAEQGIEWQQNEKIVIARGNVVATRGNLQVRSAELRAHYRERDDGEIDIWRLQAYGNVRIKSGDETAYAEKAVYDVGNGVLVLSGGDRVRLVTAKNEISADNEMEYRSKEGMLIARGNATAVQADQTVHADVLTAYLNRKDKDASRIERVEATDNVVVTTAKETMRADQGTFDAETGIATLTGSVKITRGDNQLNGCKGEMNTNTGISKLFGCGGSQSGKPRVQGLIERNK